MICPDLRDGLRKRGGGVFIMQTLKIQIYLDSDFVYSQSFQFFFIKGFRLIGIRMCPSQIFQRTWTSYTKKNCSSFSYNFQFPFYLCSQGRWCFENSKDFFKFKSKARDCLWLMTRNMLLSINFNQIIVTIQEINTFCTGKNLFQIKLSPLFLDGLI